MERSLKAIAILCVASALAFPAAAQDQTVEAAMDAVVKAIVDGFNAGDAAALTSAYAEDGDVGAPIGMIWKGRSGILEAWTAMLGAYKGSKMQISRTSLHVVSPNVVVVDGRWELSGGTIAAGHPTAGFITLIVAKQGDAWKVVSSRAKVPPSN